MPIAMWVVSKLGRTRKDRGVLAHSPGRVLKGRTFSSQRHDAFPVRRFPWPEATSFDMRVGTTLLLRDAQDMMSVTKIEEIVRATAAGRFGVRLIELNELNEVLSGPVAGGQGTSTGKGAAARDTLFGSKQGKL